MMMIVAIYTGNLNSFLLNIPTETAIETFSDLVDKTSKFYKTDHSVCVPQEHSSVRNLLESTAFLEGASLSELFNIMEKETVEECMKEVYKGTVVTTFFDAAVLNALVVERFNSKGACGRNGGLCSDPELNLDSCLCPKIITNIGCDPNIQNQIETYDSSLVLKGNQFSTFGYAIMFPLATSDRDYQVFSDVVSDLKEEGIIEDLASRWIPDSSKAECPTASDAITLELDHIYGVGLLTAGGTIIGLALGLTEHLIHFFVRVCPCHRCCTQLEEVIIETEAEAIRSHEAQFGITDNSAARHQTLLRKSSFRSPPKGRKLPKEISEKDSANEAILPPPPGLPETNRMFSLMNNIQAQLDRIEDSLFESFERMQLSETEKAQTTGGSKELSTLATARSHSPLQRPRISPSNATARAKSGDKVRSAMDKLFKTSSMKFQDAESREVIVQAGFVAFAEEAPNNAANTAEHLISEGPSS